MMKWLLLHLLKDLLIAVALLAATLVLPVAGFWMCRSSIGGTVFFFAAPFTCAVWTLLASVLVGSRFWRGSGAVRAWRAARGGYVRSAIKSTLWMFFGLFVSYAAELVVVLFLPASPLTRTLFPFATYSPAIFAALWCSRGQ